MNKNDLLIELGCEELPARMLNTLSNSFSELMKTQLEKVGFEFADIKPYATPRRLAWMISDLSDQGATQKIERRGPAMAAAYDQDGNPSKAALGFARSCDVEITQVTTIKTDKGEWLYYEAEQAGQLLSEVLPQFITHAISKLPVAKPMRWGDNDYAFVRPVHWLLVLFGDTVIPTELFGLSSDRLTYGHRFHAPQALSLSSAADYEQLLETEAKVIASFERRKTMIREQLQALTTPVIDPELLDEVTALVEWPVPLKIEFDERFLEVPSEALISAIHSHQKCFHCVDEGGTLLPYAITISNIESTNPAQVITGNQRVMKARLQDAEFFYKKDCEVDLGEWNAASQNVVFQKQLGSLHDKSERLQIIACHFAEVFSVQTGEAARVAALAKTDLQSDMVGEFPELQGIMGDYYARHAGESEAVATAIREHYLPRFADDIIPSTPLGAIAALADRIDTLVGIFGIGQKPTGEKDPFALRRAAIGIVRIAIQTPLNFSLQQAILCAHQAYKVELKESDCMDAVHDFIIERLNQYIKEQGIEASFVQAATASQRDDIADCYQRILALKEFVTLPEADSLIAANKRVRNILAKTDVDTEVLTLDHSALQDDDAIRLCADITEKHSQIKPLISNKQYKDALFELATLREPIDTFFEKVMVMVDDIKVRNNRLALLARLHRLFREIADVGVIHR